MAGTEGLRERSRGRSSGYPGMADPVRNPQNSPVPVRTKRAFLLLLLTLFIPGSAQLVAGDRKLGRKALRVTFILWALALLALVVALVDWPVLVSIATNQWGSLLLMAAMVALALFWAFLFLNTLRIIRPRLLAPGMRPILGVSLAALMVATSGSLGYGAYLLNVGRNALGSIFASGPAFAPADGRYNFLLMGGDAGSGRIGLRPDSISVLSVDAKTGHTVTFSIPRNFQNARFPDDSPLKQVYPEGFNCGDECIINALYMDVTDNHKDLYPGAKDPGAEAMKDAVSGILGIDIQAYALVDMGGFEKLIDAMGGITIKAGNWVPISNRSIPGTTNLHYPPKGWIAPGVQKLDGYHALWYGRSREFATDYDRIQRQQCVQKAMIKQLDPATVLTRFQALAEAGEQVVESDIPSGQLGSFVSLAAKAKNQEVDRLTIGPPDFGSAADNFVTYPDFDLIHQRVQAMFSAEGKTGTESPSGAAPGNGSGTSALTVARASSVLPATVGQDPEITEEYLQQLAEAGDVDTLGALLADNGKCSVP